MSPVSAAVMLSILDVTLQEGLHDALEMIQERFMRIVSGLRADSCKDKLERLGMIYSKWKLDKNT